MNGPIYIIVPIRPAQIVEALSKIVFSKSGIERKDFSLSDAKIFDIAARQIKEAHGGEK